MPEIVDLDVRETEGKAYEEVEIAYPSAAPS